LTNEDDRWALSVGGEAAGEIQFDPTFAMDAAVRLIVPFEAGVDLPGFFGEQAITFVALTLRLVATLGTVDAFLGATFESETLERDVVFLGVAGRIP
jgi:hypothetical protein